MAHTMTLEQTMPKKLTVFEVAEMFDKHPETVRRWIRKGILKAFQAGKRGRFVIYEEDALDALRYNPDAGEERQASDDEKKSGV